MALVARWPGKAASHVLDVERCTDTAYVANCSPMTTAPADACGPVIVDGEPSCRNCAAKQTERERAVIRAAAYHIERFERAKTETFGPTEERTTMTKPTTQPRRSDVVTKPKLTPEQRRRVRELIEDEGETRASATAWVLAFEPALPPVPVEARDALDGGER